MHHLFPARHRPERREPLIGSMLLIVAALWATSGLVALAVDARRLRRRTGVLSWWKVRTLTPGYLLRGPFALTALAVDEIEVRLRWRRFARAANRRRTEP